LKDLAWPIFVENILARGMGIVNIILLSKYNVEAVAAVGVANQLGMFINMLYMFVPLGTAVVVSQYLGAGNKQRAATASSVAVTLNAGIGIAVGILVLLFHHPILILMGLTGQVLAYADTYFAIVGGLSILQGLNFTFGTIMRNYGKARAPMFVFLGMNLFNLFGNTIIILHPFGLPDLGLAGIAGWTAFAQAMGLVAMIACALHYKIRLHLEKPFPAAAIREILRIGIPGSGESLAYSIANISLTFFLTSLGTSALASFAYASNLIGFIQTAGFAVGQSTQILVGRLVGAGDYDAAYRLGFRATWIAMGLNISAMVCLMALQQPILRLFTSSAEVMTIIFWCFIIDLVHEFGRPFNLVIGSCIRAAGDVKWSIAVSLSTILLVSIPLGFLFTHVMHFGVPGVFLALCVEEWLRGQLMTWRWRSRKWEVAVLVKPIYLNFTQST
jgi:putative MATE family efflux protein